jgi:hypothetical protein
LNVANTTIENLKFINKFKAVELSFIDKSKSISENTIVRKNISSVASPIANKEVVALLL